jgi:LPXTG-site transpeptidase (sortase) family protein
MDIAHRAVDVAWYKLGPKPGEVGNAVINGHINTYYSEHGVFEHLDNLNVGDVVEVVERNGATLRFVVIGKKLLDYNSPTDDIFGKTSSRNLNLITCAGTWMKDKHLYDKRLVVYTELK